MPASAYSLRASVLESLTKTKRPDVPAWVVLRNTAAVVLPLAIGMLIGYPQAGLGIAAGALDTMFSDQPGPYRQRMLRLFLAALAAGLAALLGFLIGDQLMPMLLATLILGFLGGLLVVFGPDIARVGMTSMILLVVTAATPKDAKGALIGAGLIFSGGLLLTLFAVAAWPLQRYRPERYALAAVYRGLAAVARERNHDASDAPALTDAMTMLQHTLLGRHHAHGRAMEAFGVLLELAERIRLELVAMDELHGWSDISDIFRNDAARVMTAIAEALEAGEAPRAAERAMQALRVSENALLDPSGGHGFAAHIHALSGQLAAAVRNANWAGSRGELRASSAETRLPAALRSDSALATLRANLTPQATAFRHAVRCAVCLSAAVLISRWLGLPHGYWIPMTAAIVLRPDFGATLNFGLLRVVGTVFGLLLTTILVYLSPHEGWIHLALMGVLCMIFRYLAAAHYGVAVAALTGTVVILLSFAGVDSSHAVTDRVINTALGSAMAMLAYILWPSWERGRARSALADMLDAYANYLAALAHPEQRAAHSETRTAVRTARTNARASLDRLRAEPGTPLPLLELGLAVFANGNRLARTAMTWEALLDDHPQWPQADAFSSFVEQVRLALQRIAMALREQRSVPALPDLRTLQRQLSLYLSATGERELADKLDQLSDRLVDNIDTLAYVIERSQEDLGSKPMHRSLGPDEAASQ